MNFKSIYISHDDFHQLPGNDGGMCSVGEDLSMIWKALTETGEFWEWFFCSVMLWYSSNNNTFPRCALPSTPAPLGCMAAWESRAQCFGSQVVQQGWTLQPRLSGIEAWSSDSVSFEWFIHLSAENHTLQQSSRGTARTCSLGWLCPQLWQVIVGQHICQSSQQTKGFLCRSIYPLLYCSKSEWCWRLILCFPLAGAKIWGIAGLTYLF